MDETLKLKIAIQKEAEDAHISYNCRSTIALAMGLGKSKVAINRINNLLSKTPKSKVLFCGARELYLQNFKVELKKFKFKSYIPKITFCCIQSLHKYKDIRYDLVIVDEAHLMVGSYLPFLELQFKNNSNIELICLTGTPVKRNTRLTNLVPVSIYKSIDHSIDQDFLNDYEIRIVSHKLNTEKNIHIVTPKYNFFTSEEATYRRLVGKYNDVSFDDAGNWIQQGFSKEGQYLKSFFKNSESKKQIVLRLLAQLKTHKTLIYAGSIQQADSFKLPVYHSKVEKIKRRKVYDQFCKDKTGILVNVDGIKEAVTIPGLKVGIIMHCGSNPSELSQIIGRFMRLVPKEELATIYVLIYEDTVEEKWFTKASKELDQNKIK